MVDGVNSEGERRENNPRILLNAQILIMSANILDIISFKHGRGDELTNILSVIHKCIICVYTYYILFYSNKNSMKEAFPHKETVAQET